LPAQAVLAALDIAVEGVARIYAIKGEPATSLSSNGPETQMCWTTSGLRTALSKAT